MLVVVSLLSVVAAIMLVVPPTNAYFRGMERPIRCNLPLPLAVFLTEAAGGEVGWATISASTTSTRRPRGA